MKKGLTELVFILDKSGSMSGMESDTIGGFNGNIRKEKEEDGEAYVSTIFFNSRSEVIHDRVNIKDVKDLTEKDYVVGGCTALLDAMGDAIKHISNIYKYAREEDIPERTLFIITTDGYENASHKYSSEEIKKLVKKMTDKYKWDFIFLGANIDAVETAKKYGIDEDYATNYICDSQGTEVLANACYDAIHSVRLNKKLDKKWKADLEKDYNSRSKK